MQTKRPVLAALPLAVWLLVSGCGKTAKYDEGLSVEDALKKFELKEGFTIEPFATEPHVQSPVDMVMDENGNVYVVEMGDYPYQADTLNPKGLIKFLQDTDGDGKIDTSVIFADKLPSATSIFPWKGGLLVAAAPEVFYLKDTTGDYKADIKEVVFTGFFDRNSEAQITSFRFGIDNWIYANNNGQAGSVTRKDNPQAGALNVAGTDFRFRMDDNRFENESGNGQFGLAIDDWGNRFFSHNTIYIQQSPIPDRYLKRHPYLASTRVTTKIFTDDVMFQKTPAPYWRAERSRRRQHNYDSLGLNRTEWPKDHFTGASGSTFYGGDAFPSDYYGSIFTTEVAGNLVHRTVLRRNAGKVEFEATRGAGEENREFLASTDSWFRPTTSYSAPDGNLYIVDMYMQHIETPVSIPDDLKADMDFVAGSDKGRIYRITHKDGKAIPLSSIKLGSKTSEELVALLAHPNQWHRLTAQRLLLERQDKTVIASLQQQFATHKDPRTRLHSLYALDGLGAMTAQLALAAINDVTPGVRIHGAILSERYPQNMQALLNLASDQDEQVVFQAALSIGQFNGTNVQEALAHILTKFASQPLYRTAILSSTTGASIGFLKQLVSNKFFNGQEGTQAFLEEFAFGVGVRGNSQDVKTLLSVLDNGAASTDLLFTNLEKGLKRATLSATAKGSILKVLQDYESSASAGVKEKIKPLVETIQTL